MRINTLAGTTTSTRLSLLLNPETLLYTRVAMMAMKVKSCTAAGPNVPCKHEVYNDLSPMFLTSTSAVASKHTTANGSTVLEKICPSQNDTRCTIICARTQASGLLLAMKTVVISVSRDLIR